MGPGLERGDRRGPWGERVGPGAGTGGDPRSEKAGPGGRTDPEVREWDLGGRRGP